MKKQITIQEFKSLIKEGVSRLHKQTLIENRIKQINQEIISLNESDANVDKLSDLANKGKDRLSDLANKETGYEKLLKWYKENPGKTHPSSQSSGDDIRTIAYENTDFLGEGDIMGQEEYEILESYLEAALWTEEDEIGHASISEVSDESREKANQDVLNFMQQAGPLLDGIEPEQVGHDLWLTRNGHGAGFWDRGLGEIGDQLSEIARAMGSKYAYRGDDGLIYID